MITYPSTKINFNFFSQVTMKMKIAAICQPNRPKIFISFLCYSGMLYIFFFVQMYVAEWKEKNGTKKTFTQMYVSIRKKMMMMVKKIFFFEFLWMRCTKK